MNDDIVLNDGLYSAAENSKGFKSMEGRVMPFSHPEVNGQYIAISALDSPEAAVALGKHYGGVHAQNVRKQGSEYFADVMVNDRVAKSHPDGEMLGNWIDKAEDYQANGAEKPDPIQMSTGLMTQRIAANGESRGKKYSWIAANQQYDHLAILFHEQGAGGNDVAIAVNCDQVINSVLPTVNEDALDDSYGEKLDRLSAAVMDRFGSGEMHAWVMDFDDQALVYSNGDGKFSIEYHYEGDQVVFTGESKPVITETKYKYSNNSVVMKLWRNMLNYFSVKPKAPAVQANETEEQDMTPEEVQAIVDKAVGAAVDAVNQKLTSSEAEVKKLQEAMQANSDAALAEKRAAVAKVHTEVVANALSGEALDAMYASVQTAAGIVSGAPVTNSDELKTPSMAEHFGGAK
jgi:hypothetical protein